MSLTLACAAVPVTMASATTITFLQGDVSGDGAVSIADATMFTKFLNGNVYFDDAMLRRADAHEDALIDMSDYNKIRNCCFGLETPTTQTKSTYTNVNNESRTYLKHTMRTTNTSYSTYTLNAPAGADVNSISYTMPTIYEDTENTNTIVINTGDGYASGFIVSDHVVATAAHCVGHVESGRFVFNNNISIEIWAEDSLRNKLADFTPRYIHIPQNAVGSTDIIEEYDYALLYFQNDLSSYGIWSIGYMTDEFIESGNKNVTTSGFADAPNNYRQYSEGAIITSNYTDYRFDSYAQVKESFSGGPAYYKSVNEDNTIKTVVGIISTGNVTENEYIYTESGCVRITPTVARFFLDNPNL